MPIIAAGQRRYLMDKGLVYLFSYDLPMYEGERVGPDGADAPENTFGFVPVPGGVRLETYLRKPTIDRPAPKNDDSPPSPYAIWPFSPWEVYHVDDDISVEGNDAITGSVMMSRDSVFLPRGEKFGSIDGSLIIVTEDDAVIDTRYRGCLSVGALGIGHFDDVAPGEEVGATRAKIFIALRFETSYSKYKWLTERLCAGFGVVDIENGRASRATVDIYALKSDNAR